MYIYSYDERTNRHGLLFKLNLNLGLIISVGDVCKNKQHFRRVGNLVLKKIIKVREFCQADSVGTMIIIILILFALYLVVYII